MVSVGKRRRALMPTAVLPPRYRPGAVTMLARGLAAASALLASLALAEDVIIQVHAAGSLRAALSAAAEDFAKRPEGARVAFAFGPSGQLKGRLENGEESDVFASANLEHPRALTEAGRAGPVRAFARNTLCALVAAHIDVTPATLLDTLLDPQVKVGISTPRVDPSGDYALQFFANAEKVKPGARQMLEAKALQLIGGPNSPPPSRDRSVYGALVAKGVADVFLTYSTNAILAKKEEPQLQVVAIPESLAVVAEYGVVVMHGARPAGGRFADFLLSSAGREILGGFGFLPPE